MFPVRRLADNLRMMMMSEDYKTCRKHLASVTASLGRVATAISNLNLQQTWSNQDECHSKKDGPPGCETLNGPGSDS